MFNEEKEEDFIFWEEQFFEKKESALNRKCKKCGVVVTVPCSKCTTDEQ